MRVLRVSTVVLMASFLGACATAQPAPILPSTTPRPDSSTPAASGSLSEQPSTAAPLATRLGTTEPSVSPVPGEAARGYVDAATQVNAAVERWAADVQSFGKEANASTGLPQQKFHLFVVKFLPRCHVLARAVRTYEQEVQGLKLTPEQRVIADRLAGHLDFLTGYLERWTDPDTFITDMGTLDSWLVAWYDVTGLVWSTARDLRTALALPEAATGW